MIRMRSYVLWNDTQAGLSASCDKSKCAIQFLHILNGEKKGGFVTDDEKKAALVDADVFITPSFSGFPILFIEACACGTSIITTNKGDKLEWIHDKVGYVVDFEKKQLQDAMIKVLSDEALKRRFGEEGKRLAREEFDWDKVVKRVEKIYKEIIEEVL